MNREALIRIITNIAHCEVGDLLVYEKRGDLLCARVRTDKPTYDTICKVLSERLSETTRISITRTD